jgi:hypothetical protein
MLPLSQARVNLIPPVGRRISLWERLCIDYKALSAWPGTLNG